MSSIPCNLNQQLLHACFGSRSRGEARLFQWRNRRRVSRGLSILTARTYERDRRVVSPNVYVASRPLRPWDDTTSRRIVPDAGRDNNLPVRPVKER